MAHFLTLCLGRDKHRFRASTTQIPSMDFKFKTPNSTIPWMDCCRHWGRGCNGANTRRVHIQKA